MLLSFDLNRKASKTQSESFRGFLFLLEVDNQLCFADRIGKKSSNDEAFKTFPQEWSDLTTPVSRSNHRCGKV